VKPSDTHDIDTYPRVPSPDAIAARAHALYEGRGGTPGDGRAAEDWLQAEQQLLHELEVQRLDRRKPAPLKPAPAA